MKKFFLFFLLPVFLVSAPMKTRLHVCTDATERTKGLNQLLHSCQVRGVHIDVVGLGTEWTGFGHKLIYFKQYLEKIPDHDVVMYIDGYDSLMMNNKYAILTKFLQKKINCLFSADTNCWPRGDLAPRFPHSPTKWKYLSAGGCIGYAWYFKKVLNELEFTGRSDDQELYSIYYLDHQDEIELDYYCEFFFPLNDEVFENLSILPRTRRVLNPHTRTVPFILHGCGWDKSVYQRLYEALYQ